MLALLIAYMSVALYALIQALVMLAREPRRPGELWEPMDFVMMGAAGLAASVFWLPLAAFYAAGWLRSGRATRVLGALETRPAFSLPRTRMRIAWHTDAPPVGHRARG